MRHSHSVTTAMRSDLSAVEHDGTPRYAVEATTASWRLVERRHLRRVVIARKPSRRAVHRLLAPVVPSKIVVRRA